MIKTYCRNCKYLKYPKYELGVYDSLKLKCKKGRTIKIIQNWYQKKFIVERFTKDPSLLNRKNNCKVFEKGEIK